MYYGATYWRCNILHNDSVYRDMFECVNIGDFVASYHMISS